MNTKFFSNIDRIVSEATALVSEIKNRPPRKPIYVNVVFHKELGFTTERNFQKTHLALAKEHIEKISGREVIVNVIHDPKMRDFNYKSDNDIENGLREHFNRNTSSAQSYKSEKPDIEKILFVTPDYLSFNTPGEVERGHSFGVTAHNNARGAAHALGLMLGATRGDAEITYNGWWNDTVMKHNRESFLRGNDLNYSDANKQNIRKYLDKFD